MPRLEIDLRRQFAIEPVVAGKVTAGNQSSEVIFSGKDLPFASHVFSDISFVASTRFGSFPDARVRPAEIERVAASSYNPLVENEFDRKFGTLAEVPVLGRMFDAVETLFNREKQRKMLKRMLDRQVAEGAFPDRSELPALNWRLGKSDATWIAKDVVVATLAGWSGNLLALSFGMLKGAEGVINGSLNIGSVASETAFVLWAAPMVIKLAYTIPRIVMESNYIARNYPISKMENWQTWGRNMAIFAGVVVSDFLPVVSWGAHGLLTSQRNGELATLTMTELKSSFNKKWQGAREFINGERNKKEREALRTKIKDPETLIVATLDIGKGNPLYAKVIKDTLDWLGRNTDSAGFKRAEVVYLDRLIDSLPRRFHFWLIKKLHGFIARHGLVSQVYSFLTDRGARNNFVFGKWLGKPLADLLYENGHKLVVATSVDAAGALKQNGKDDLRIVPISTDLLLRNSAIGQFSEILVQSWETAQNAGRTIKERTGFLAREDLRDTFRVVGLLVHPKIIDQLPISTLRRERRFSEEAAEPLNILDVASGSGVNSRRALELLKGLKEGVNEGGVNLTFWMGKDRRAVIQILNLARKMNLPVEVVDGQKFNQLGYFQDTEKSLFGRPINSKMGTGIKIVYDPVLETAMDLLIDCYIHTDVLMGGPDETTLWAAGSRIPKITHTQDARGSWEKANALWSKRMGFSLGLARNERRNLSAIIKQMRQERYKGYNLKSMLSSTCQVT